MSIRQFFKNKHLRPAFIKLIAVFALFCVTFYGAYGMAKSFLQVMHQKKVQKKEAIDIQNRLNNIESQTGENADFTKEKVLREKLHMIKPGEELIILEPNSKDNIPK